MTRCSPANVLLSKTKTVKSVVVLLSGTQTRNLRNRNEEKATLPLGQEGPVVHQLTHARTQRLVLRPSLLYSGQIDLRARH